MFSCSCSVYGNGLSRRQQGFKSPWGRHEKYKAVRLNLAAFFVAGVKGRCPDLFNLIVSKVQYSIRDNRGELALSKAGGNPGGDTTF